MCVCEFAAVHSPIMRDEWAFRSAADFIPTDANNLDEHIPHARHPDHQVLSLIDVLCDVNSWRQHELARGVRCVHLEGQNVATCCTHWTTKTQLARDLMRAHMGTRSIVKFTHNYTA